jgi:hypothetical protein
LHTNLSHLLLFLPCKERQLARAEKDCNLAKIPCFQRASPFPLQHTTPFSLRPLSQDQTPSSTQTKASTLKTQPLTRPSSQKSKPSSSSTTADPAATTSTRGVHKSSSSGSSHPVFHASRPGQRSRSSSFNNGRSSGGSGSRSPTLTKKSASKEAVAKDAKDAAGGSGSAGSGGDKEADGASTM